MFWSNKQEAPPARKGEGDADLVQDKKPCCSDTHESADQGNDQEAVTEQHPPTVSTFEFLSSPTSGVRLTGVCQSTDANEIKACLWSPTHAAVKNRIYF